jgi:histidyl-tRNA synthetase
VLVIGDGVAPEQLSEVGRLCRSSRSTAVDYTERSLAAKMRAANKVGAPWVVLMNAEEASRQVAQLKEMAGGGQREVAWRDLPEALA